MEQMQWLLGHNHDDAQSGKKKLIGKKHTLPKKNGCEEFKEKKLNSF